MQDLILFISVVFNDFVFICSLQFYFTYLYRGKERREEEKGAGGKGLRGNLQDSTMFSIPYAVLSIHRDLDKNYRCVRPRRKIPCASRYKYLTAYRGKKSQTLTIRKIREYFLRE